MKRCSDEGSVNKEPLFVKLEKDIEKLKDTMLEKYATSKNQIDRVSTKLIRESSDAARLEIYKAKEEFNSAQKAIFGPIFGFSEE